MVVVICNALALSENFGRFPDLKIQKLDDLTLNCKDNVLIDKICSQMTKMDDNTKYLQL